jgi:recombination protein RecR
MAFLGIPALDRLITELTRLPGIGRKTAQRLAIFILKGDKEYAHSLAEAIFQLREQTRLCLQCFNISEQDLCAVCGDARRDRTRICVVEDIVDIIAIEESHEYRGLYHVLSGVISPLAGVSPRDLHIQELFERVQQQGVEEVILALNPSTEGEATMIYIAHLLKDMNVHITRIASGVPIGSHLEFLDTATIGRAIAARRDL